MASEHERSIWRHPIVTSAAAAIFATILSAGVSVYVLDRTLSESRRQLDRQLATSREQLAAQLNASRGEVDRQLAADRAGRVSDQRARTYGQFLSAADRHLDILQGGTHSVISAADRDVYTGLRLVQLVGSSDAYLRAASVASRARRMGNYALDHIGGDQLQTKPYVAQQDALNGFVDAVQRELQK